MRQSTVVEGWINEGRQEGPMQGQLRQARQTLTRLLGKRLNPLPAGLSAQIEQVTDPAKLDLAIERFFDGAAPDELFR